MATPLMATLTSLAAAPALAWWQWRATRGHALDRAVVKVCVLSFAVPTLLLTLTYQLPRLFGQPPLIESLPALSAINFLMFIGFGLGIARFRLFLLDRWWFETLLWAIGGAAVIVLDLVLLWFNASVGLALGLSLALAGWAYFPARQWPWQRFDRGPAQRLERHLPHLVDQLFQAESRAELAQRWQALVEDIFQPSTISVHADASEVPQIAQHGQALLIPALEPGAAVLLEHAAKGQRLFGPSDVRLAAELLALTRRAADARQALEQRHAERDARLREREAMVQDLHDGLGGLASNIALLAGMAQRDTAHDARRTLGTIEQLAAESLSEIRGFMSSLDAQDGDWEALVADLRADASRRLEPHGVQLDMSAAIDRGCAPPEALLRLNVTRLCQEALNNVVKHAAATRVTLTLSVTSHRLVLTIADDGRGLPADGDTARPSSPGVRSRGLGIMRRRAQQLGGTLRWDSVRGTTVSLTVPLPLFSPAPGMPASPVHG
jgi:signal transduction histidine kinase